MQIRIRIGINDTYHPDTNISSISSVAAAADAWQIIGKR
jgi:hypothetical protein